MVEAYGGRVVVTGVVGGMSTTSVLASLAAGKRAFRAAPSAAVRAKTGASAR